MSQIDEIPMATSGVPAPKSASPKFTAGKPRNRQFLDFFEKYILVILVLVVILFFSFYPPTSETFPTWANFQATVGSQAVVAIVALGALVPLTCDQWDLSVGAISGLSSIFVAAALGSGVPILLAIGLGVMLGVLIGILNSFILLKLRVHTLIGTLAVSTVIAGIINQKTGGLPVNRDIPSSITDLGTQNWFGIPAVVYILAVIAVAVYYLLEHTPVGRYLNALGSNPEAARLVGLRTNRLVIMAFIVAGILCGLAGILQVARSGGADPRVGELFTLPALAAGFLSAASIKPGRYNVGGVLVAICFLAAINSGLNLAGVPAYVSSYVNGGALIVGVALSSMLARKRAGDRS